MAEANAASMAFLNAAGSGDEDSDMEFEEVLNNPENDLNAPTKRKPVEADDPTLQQEEEGIEIVLENGKTVSKGKGKPKRKGISGIERKLRLETHRLHVFCLLVATKVRNDLLNDELLQARLLSKTPIHLINAFSSFQPSTHPQAIHRSRMFETALKNLISHWYATYIPRPEVATLVSKTYADAIKDGIFDLEKDQNVPGETIRSAQSLMKRALNSSGSIDMSAQLFVSLCRSLKIAARLVVSLQPLDWRAAGNAIFTDEEEKEKEVKETKRESKGKGKAGKNTKPREKKKPISGISKLAKRAGIAQSDFNWGSARRIGSTSGRGAGSTTATATEESDVEMEAVPIPSGSRSRPVSVDVESIGGGFMKSADESDQSKGKKAFVPAVRLRKTKSVKQQDPERSPSPDASEEQVCPVYWCEIYNRANKEWVVVDVTRKKMRCADKMEPAKTNKVNKMSYVIAIEEDGSIRDVTSRYTRAYTATMKLRAPSTGGQGDWWEAALAPFKRTYALARDEAESNQLQQNQTHEAMPTSITAFKNHPLYALERHLLRDEVIFPKKQLGLIREEPVYRRSDVVSLKSSEQYMREGLQIKEGEQPMKMVKSRAATINKRRAHELAIQEGREEDTMQGLYARWQTSQVVPDPVVDGKVPRNGYGNVDLFAPHMLPPGGVHLPYKGIAKIAKQLGISYAEAVTGFEFHKRRAVPSVEGIVVPIESQEVVLDAYWAAEHAAVERAFTKKQERALKRWKKLIVGLTIRTRLQNDYGPQPAKAIASTSRGKQPVIKARDMADPAEAEQSQFHEVDQDAEEDASTGSALAKESAPAPVHNSLPVFPTENGNKSKYRSKNDISTISSDSEEDVKPVIPTSSPKRSPAKSTKSRTSSARSSVRKRSYDEDGDEEDFSPDEVPKKKTRTTRATASARSTNESPRPSRSKRASKAAISYKEDDPLEISD